MTMLSPNARDGTSLPVEDELLLEDHVLCLLLSSTIEVISSVSGSSFGPWPRLAHSSSSASWTVVELLSTFRRRDTSRCSRRWRSGR